MNSRYSAQDVLRCHQCDTPVPPLGCDLCNIYLCKTCVGEHILDGSTGHKIVPIQQILFDRVFPKRPKHSTKLCKLYCEDCTIPICIQCASCTEHQSHIFVDLLKFVENKKEVIQRDLKEMELSILSKHKEIATNIQSQKAYLQKTAGSLKAAIDEQGQKLHTEVDAIVKKLKSEVDENEEMEFSVLKEDEKEITRKISNIEKCILNQKELQVSRYLGPVIEYKSRNHEFRKVIFPKYDVLMPTFTANHFTTEQLHTQFGSLTKVPKPVVQDTLKACRQLARTTEEVRQKENNAEEQSGKVDRELDNLNFAETWPSTTSASDKLPLWWERTQDRYGRYYYVNHITRTTQWDPPHDQTRRDGKLDDQE